jgi:endonuclease/exonuclease/phosphatase family metal-dependent hydrolase
VSIEKRHIVFALILALLSGCIAWAVARGADAFSTPRRLRIATWNLEWLMDPDTARDARIACREHRRAVVPCDVARTLGRDSADFGRLAAVVLRLDADVIAFQEVQSAEVAQRVFRGYRICISDGRGVQHAGFAVRPSLNTRCEPPLQTLAQGGGRAGQVLTLIPPDGAAIELLAVHLKSGCARDALDSATTACRMLSAQAQALGEWIEPRAATGSPFIVLGDLNRGGVPGDEDAFWSLLHPAAFEAAASRLPYGNCVFGAPYREFIDHILLSRSLLPRLDAEGFRHWVFRPAEATSFRLSDHCPVSVGLSLFSSL